MTLPQDKFTQLTPLWYLSENKKSVYLQLPMNSKLCDLIQFSVTLSESLPEEGIELYLHAIEQRPVYPRSDASNNRKLVFYDLLHQSEGLAILYAKRMPKFSAVTFHGVVMATSYVLGEHAENIVAAITLETLQAKYVDT